MDEPIASLLARLSLERYAEVFEEEAITDSSLLVSMGAEMLRENLEELGLDDAAVTKLAAELFPDGGADDDAGLQLEDNGNATGGPPLNTTQGPSVPASSVTVDALPNDLTQDEIDAAEAEAQWLLNPLSLVDLSETKDRLMKMMADGIAYQRSEQYANARSVFTRALAMEAPNKRMSAALYYNRSACQRALGQLALALRDAQKAYEIEPSFTRAHWRAADIAIILDDQEAAREAVEAGLKHAPRCQPLLQAKLKVQRF